MLLVGAMCTGLGSSLLLSLLLLCTSVYSAPSNTLCRKPGVVVQNSLWYCRQHYGLSLINARRHQCQLCFLFNVVVIRNTPSDQTHHSMIQQHLHVPLFGDMRYTVQRFCADDLMQRLHEGHAIDSHYNHTGNIHDGIPKNSVVYTDKTDNNTVVAWVHILRLMDDGKWDSVNQHQYQELNRIFLEERRCAQCKGTDS